MLMKLGQVEDIYFLSELFPNSTTILNLVDKYTNVVLFCDGWPYLEEITKKQKDSLRAKGSGRLSHHVKGILQLPIGEYLKENFPSTNPLPS
jgi:hypothetical protein